MTDDLNDRTPWRKWRENTLMTEHLDHMSHLDLEDSNNNNNNNNKIPTTLWLMLLHHQTKYKCSVIHKISARQAFTDILNICCDLDLEHSNPIFPQDTLAYDAVL